MPSFQNLACFSLAKTDQTLGTTGLVRWPIYTVGGVVPEPFPGNTTSDTTYFNSGDRYMDPVPNPISVSGSINGAVDMEGLGAIYTAFNAIDTATDLTGAYQYDWSTIGAGIPVVIETNYSDAATSTARHEYCLFNSLSFTGMQGSANAGKMSFTLGYTAGKITLGNANPSLSTIDFQDIPGLGNVANRVTVIQFVTSASTTISYQSNTNQVTYTMNRNVSHAPPDLTAGIALGKAYYDKDMTFEVDFPISTLKSTGTAAQPYYGDFAPAWGATGTTLGATPGPSDVGTATVTVYGQETAATGTYFKHSWTGTAILEPSIDTNNYGGTMKMKFTAVPTITIVNETASYAQPT